MAEHRVELGELLDLRPQRGRVAAERPRHLGDLLVAVRQELVQGRVEQPDRDRQPRHRAKDLREVSALHGQQLGERPLARGAVRGEDHLAHRQDAARLEEHVLGAAQADALGPELTRHARVRRRVGVRSHRQRPDPVGPAHQLGEGAAERGRHHRDLTLHHLAGAPVEGDHVAGAERRPAHAHLARRVVDA
jgi:hypothetical protein